MWVDTIGRSRRVRIAPVAPGDAIGRWLLDERPVIAVSATLGGEPPFTAVASQLGFQPTLGPGRWGERSDDGRLTSKAGRGYVALQTPSSFDWREQGLLYVGKDMPDPGKERAAWLDAAGERLCQLVNAAGGRALVLCTSHANVGHFSDVLRSRTTHEILAQGDTDSGRLARVCGRRNLGACRHAIILGRYRRGRRLMRPRRDRQDPIPRPGRPHARRSSRPRPRARCGPLPRR